MLISAMSAISGRPQEKRPLLSQNGYKMRTICRECNSMMGREYDPVIGRFCADINGYLRSPLTLPPEAHFNTLPRRLICGVFGHLLAAKLDPDECVIDQRLREYLSDSAGVLHPDLGLFYWLYPHPRISVIREFATILPTRDRRAAVSSVIKFPPLAFLLTEVKEFYGLPDLGSVSHFAIDDPGRVHLQFSEVRPPDWPEGTQYSGFVFMGKAGTQSLYGISRSPQRR
jgi:hypothetical protein